MATCHWTRELVVEQIKRLSVDNRNLMHGNAMRSHCKLVRAAMRYFGSWASAVTAAGIDYASIRKESRRIYSAKAAKWCKESISREIGKLIDAGESVASATVQREHPALFGAAVSRLYFRSWRNALTAQGVDYDLILAASRERCIQGSRTRWMRTLLRSLAALSDSVGQISEEEAKRRYPQLYDKAARYFGGWNEAVDAALKHKEVRKLGVSRW
ncbi:MAG: hypothetical protein A2Z18_09250 [Armatimonadetes bacterium RBG_16_58_9]|nr:MAG: hypothetical protein A2Z18_09250 [Armatimonadetes bacterium RBG_16_58_9]